MTNCGKAQFLWGSTVFHVDRFLCNGLAVRESAPFALTNPAEPHTSAHTARLRLHPNGDSAENRGQVAVFVHFGRPLPPHHQVDIRLDLFARDLHHSQVLGVRTTDHTSWGIDALVERAQLARQLRPDEGLRLFCYVGVRPGFTLHPRLGQIRAWTEDEGKDLVIEGKENRFMIHKSRLLDRVGHMVQKSIQSALCIRLCKRDGTFFQDETVAEFLKLLYLNKEPNKAELIELTELAQLLACEDLFMYCQNRLILEMDLESSAAHARLRPDKSALVFNEALRDLEEARQAQLCQA